MPLQHSFSNEDGAFSDYNVGLLNQYTFMRGSLVGFRQDDYKLAFKGVGLVTAGNKFKKPKTYNLAVAPSEKKNLTKKEKDKYAEMVKTAEAYLESIGEPAAPLCDFDD